MRDSTRALLVAFIARRSGPPSRGGGWTDGTLLHVGGTLLARHTERGPRILAPYPAPVWRQTGRWGHYVPRPPLRGYAAEAAHALTRLFPGAVHCATPEDVRGIFLPEPEEGT